jgi:hypothetical protein
MMNKGVIDGRMWVYAIGIVRVEDMRRLERELFEECYKTLFVTLVANI